MNNFQSQLGHHTMGRAVAFSLVWVLLSGLVLSKTQPAQQPFEANSFTPFSPSFRTFNPKLERRLYPLPQPTEASFRKHRSRWVREQRGQLPGQYNQNIGPFQLVDGLLWFGITLFIWVLMEESLS
jgi:hypothetical protein